jgi:hypothetical protein
VKNVVAFVETCIVTTAGRSCGACRVEDHRIATILLRSAQRPVASPQTHRPYTFLKALFKTRSESLCSPLETPKVDYTSPDSTAA